MTAFHHHLNHLQSEFALQVAINEYRHQAGIRARNPFFMTVVGWPADDAPA